MVNDGEASSEGSEVSSSNIFEALRSCEQDQLIKIIKRLSKENSTLQDKIDEQEEEISCLGTETSIWYKKLKESENALKETRNQLSLFESMYSNSSRMCDRCTSGSSGNVNVSSPESISQVSLQAIMEKLDCISQSINEKTVNQTVFVRQRYGLGYSGNQDLEGTCSSETEKV